jgi:hypothetical protein
MNDEPVTLVRYGLMGNVGRFSGSLPDNPATGLKRGQLVVIQTDRGDELGEVLLHLPSSSWEQKLPERSQETNAAGPSTSTVGASAEWPRLVRSALPADLENSVQAQRLRGERFDLCRQILDGGCWPVELLDVEPLLDLNTTVLHILGPSGLDLALLRAEFQGRCDFRVVLEHVASHPFSSFGGATEPFSVPVRGWCEYCNCAQCFAPAHQECASDDEEETREQSSMAAVAFCGDRARTCCAGCDIAMRLACKR